MSAGTERIASIDIFRGLTMLAMIFVNDLAEVHSLPWWTYHAHAKQDVMTYVDMVFPFFLFIVGLAMPLAVARRLERNTSLPALCWHIFSRSAGLVVLGLILANAEQGDSVRMGISKNLWALIGLLGAIFFWLAPSRDPRTARLFQILRFTGLAMLIAAYAIFRRTTVDGHPAWIDASYPEILGLIGYTYLATSTLYLLTRRWLWAPLLWAVTLTLICAVLTAKHSPLDLVAMASISMAGVVVSAILFGQHRWPITQARTRMAVSFAVAALVAGRLLTSLGISKIRATPTWCLYSIGAATLIFVLLYWLCDVRKQRGWAAFVYPAGENALLTYLLPDIYYFATALVGFVYFDTHFNAGSEGVLRALVFTFAMLALSTFLTRARVRLQL